MPQATRRGFLIGAGAAPLCLVSSRAEAADAAAPVPTASERMMWNLAKAVPAWQA